MIVRVFNPAKVYYSTIVNNCTWQLRYVNYRSLNNNIITKKGQHFESQTVLFVDIN